MLQILSDNVNLRRSITKLLASATAGRLLALLVTPALTRIYSPDVYGLASVFISIILIVLPIATLRLELAIPISEDESEARNIAQVALLSTFFFALIGGAALVALDVMGVSPGAMAGFGGALYLLPLGLLICSLNEVLVAFAIRAGRVTNIARAQLAQVVAGLVTKLLGGILSPAPLPLIAGQIVQQGGGLVLLSRSSGRMVLSFELGRSFWRDVIGVLKRFTDFPMIRMPSQLIQVISAKAPVLILAASFSVEFAGQFALAFSLLAVPVMLLGNSAGSALYAEICRFSLTQKREMRSKVLALLAWLAVAALPPVLILWLFGRHLFPIIFGEDWALAGAVASTMSWYLYLQILASPIMHVFTVLRLSKSVLLISVIRLLLTLGVFYAAAVTEHSELETIRWFSLALTCYYLSVLSYVLVVLSAPEAVR